MKPNQPEAAAKSTVSIQHVLSAIFRRRWMILSFAVVGFSGAAAVLVLREPLYESRAKLLVRYVLSRETVDSRQSQAAPGGGRSDPVILTEIEILSSTDLARDVAADVGATRIAPGADPTGAAAVILSGLKAGTGRSNQIVHLSYKHPNREISKEVLHRLVDRYFRRHLDIHRSAAAHDFVSTEAETVRQQLVETERILNSLRTESGILSMADATGALASQRSRTQEDVMEARAELAEWQARLTTLTPNKPKEPIGKDAPDPGTDSPPADVVAEYRTLMEMDGFLRKRETELRIKFKPGSRLLELNARQIGECRQKIDAMLALHPELAVQSAVSPDDTAKTDSGPAAAKARIAAAKSKIEVYETHLAEISRLFAEQYSLGVRIDELERQRGMLETEYRTLEMKLKNARLDLTLDPSRMPNITVVEKPTEPIRTYDDRSDRLVLGFAGGGVGLGLAFALLLELFLDRRVRSPLDIRTQLRIPLLMSIPLIRRTSSQPLTLPQRGRGDHRFILPYAEAIRDRILLNFQLRQITHKPKLVAVTGLSKQAGTSTIAAGIAESYAQMPGTKVLLVDLSHVNGAPTATAHGLLPSIDEALELAVDDGFRSSPQRVYRTLARTGRNHGNPSPLTAMHLHEMMPRLKASEYDCIVFDMPAVSQTSRTSVMASMMDKVLLVLDAENTNREALQQAYSELSQGKGDVSCVFNKTNADMPAWLGGSP
jgi:uncharacterized protein involved in exopolysaccharide biosynthesis/Mrp family chromosome partitioning ATPase